MGVYVSGAGESRGARARKFAGPPAVCKERIVLSLPLSLLGRTLISSRYSPVYLPRRVNSRDKVVLTSTNDLCALFFVSGNTFLERGTSLSLSPRAPRLFSPSLPARGKNSLVRKFYLPLANAFILSRKYATTAPLSLSFG